MLKANCVTNRASGPDRDVEAGYKSFARNGSVRLCFVDPGAFTVVGLGAFCFIVRSRPAETLQGGCLRCMARYMTEAVHLPRPIGRFVTVNLPPNIAV
jgi:hypothetical protein